MISGVYVFFGVPAQANPHDQVKLDIHKKIARWLYGRNIQPPPNHLFLERALNGNGNDVFDEVGFL